MTSSNFKSNEEDTMKVNIDVDLARNVDDLRAMIIEAIANKVLYGVSYDEDGNGHTVPTKISRELREAMSKAIRAEVEKSVGPAVQAALAEGVQRTDTYGEPRGPKVPLRTVIVDEATKVLEKRVEVRDNYGRTESLYQQIVRDEVQRALAKELQDAINGEKTKVKALVRDKAAEIITKSVGEAIPF